MAGTNQPVPIGDRNQYNIKLFNKVSAVHKPMYQNCSSKKYAVGITNVINT